MTISLLGDDHFASAHDDLSTLNADSLPSDVVARL
jgi:hypothetical protein